LERRWWRWSYLEGRQHATLEIVRCRGNIVECAIEQRLDRIERHRTSHAVRESELLLGQESLVDSLREHNVVGHDAGRVAKVEPHVLHRRAEARIDHGSEHRTLLVSIQDLRPGVSVQARSLAHTLTRTYGTKVPQLRDPQLLLLGRGAPRHHGAVIEHEQVVRKVGRGGGIGATAAELLDLLHEGRVVERRCAVVLHMQHVVKVRCHQAIGAQPCAQAVQIQRGRYGMVCCTAIWLQTT